MAIKMQRLSQLCSEKAAVKQQDKQPNGVLFRRRRKANRKKKTECF